MERLLVVGELGYGIHAMKTSCIRHSDIKKKKIRKIQFKLFQFYKLHLDQFRRLAKGKKPTCLGNPIQEPGRIQSLGSQKSWTRLRD